MVGSANFTTSSQANEEMCVKIRRLLSNGLDRVQDRFATIWGGARPMTDVLAEEATLPPRRR